MSPSVIKQLSFRGEKFRRSVKQP